jgi:MarR family transcriptional regulator, organic hydroperoxide resistance regulator
MPKRNNLSRPEAAALFESLALEVRRFIAGAILFNHKVAEQLGMNATDLQCLHLLLLNGSAMKPGELGRRCGLSSGGVTVVLDRLEKAGYVRREDNPDDRRSVIVRPLMGPIRKLEAIYRSKGEGLARVMARYQARELQLILDFFKTANAQSDA